MLRNEYLGAKIELIGPFFYGLVKKVGICISF